MTIQDLGSIGELVAAVATIATLGYLAIQLRQNTATVRGASAASHSQTTNGLNTLLAGNAEVSRILWLGLADPSQLDQEEIRRFHSVLHMIVENVQQSWRFHHDGLVDDAAWSGQRASLVWLASEPGFLPYWERYGSMQHAGFARLVEDVLKNESSDSHRRSGAV